MMVLAKLYQCMLCTLWRDEFGMKPPNINSAEAIMLKTHWTQMVPFGMNYMNIIMCMQSLCDEYIFK